MTQPMTFPNDANGDALRRLQRDGDPDPLTQPRDVDFTVVFATETAAKEFAARFLAQGTESPSSRHIANKTYRGMFYS